MPQVHNKSIVLDTAATGKNSRFGAATEGSKEQRKHMQAMTTVDKKQRDMRLAVDKRHLLIYLAKYSTMKQKYTNALRRKMAYRDVLETKTFSKITERRLRLDTNYTIHALRFELAEALEKRDPNAVRQKHARSKADAQRVQYNDIMARSLRKIKSPRTQRRRELRRRMGLPASDSEDSSASEDSEVESEDDSEAGTSQVPNKPGGRQVLPKIPTKTVVIKKEDMLSKRKTGTSDMTNLPSRPVLPPVLPPGSNSKLPPLQTSTPANTSKLPPLQTSTPANTSKLPPLQPQPPGSPHHDTNKPSTHQVLPSISEDLTTPVPPQHNQHTLRSSFKPLPEISSES